MGKTFRLLQLINLLNSRRSVTLDMIKRTCGIPERTAYRYLNAISEVDVPVYFDKETRAYRLTQKSPSGIDDLSLGDTVLVVAALKLLNRFVSEDYSDEIGRLLTKVLVRQELPVEEALPIIDDHVTGIDKSERLTETLSSALIHTAIACNKKVEVTTGHNSSPESTLTIGSPALFFKDSWQLHERQRADGQVTPVRQIRRVKIL